MASIENSSFVFDHMASSYDDDFTHSLTGRAQRNMVWRFLEDGNFLKQGISCLEINCGTGEDAVFMQENGVIVSVSDRSSEMCDIVQRKGVNEVKRASFHELKDVFNGRKFDFVFSNFGGLNCVDSKEFTRTFENLAGLLSEGGRVVAVIMPKVCIWEHLYFLLKGQGQKMTRRWKKEGVSFEMNGDEVQTHYYSPRQVLKLVSSHFKVIRNKPIGVAIPPSYLENIARKSGLLFKIWNSIDTFLYKSGLWPAAIADHFIVELQKR